jgi:hypothetical protein
MTITITEALAEVKTIGKRLEKKRANVLQFLARQDGIKDPLEKEGGSVNFVAAERQSIADLGQRVVTLRAGIQKANEANTITIAGKTRSIADWLIWRRDVASAEGAFLNQLRSQLNAVRQQAQKQQSTVVPAGAVASSPADYVVNLDEQELARQIEAHEEMLGTLDGQLSLKNATTQIAA